ncbi:MAG: hypothetical protein Q9190_001062 [Brigantiaea leucoxantha]
MPAGMQNVAGLVTVYQDLSDAIPISIIIICNTEHWSSTASSDSSGLNVSAKVGISVGVVLGFGFIVLLCVLLYRIRSYQRQLNTIVTAAAKTQQEYPVASRDTWASQQRRYEVSGKALDPELDPNRAFTELSNTPATG